jgi:uncharacterized protein (TIGR03083 family)
MTIASAVTRAAHIGPAEAARLATAEYDRMLSLLRSLEDSDWAAPTDCTEWSVRDMVAHLVGTAESASLREQVRVALKGRRIAKRRKVAHIDGINAVQIEERAGLGPRELIDRLQCAAPRFVEFRSRFPRVLRGVRVPAPAGPLSLGSLMDVVYTRDVWIHRVDITRATARPMLLTPDHDGMIVADVAAEWARCHGKPAALHLEGPAGGSFVFGTGGTEERLDAVEFCRMLAGRTPGSGLLATPVNF